MTNKEEYVSSVLAKLLKCIGYNEPCQYIIDVNTNIPQKYDYDDICGRNDVLESNFCSLPTLYQAKKWVEKKFGKYITVFPTYFENDGIITFRYLISDYIDVYDGKKGKLSKNICERECDALNIALCEIIEIIERELDDFINN